MAEKRDIQHEVMSLVGLSEESYELLRFELAYDYLKLATNNSGEIIKELVKTKHFWNWWLMQYERVDEVFSNKRYVLRINQHVPPIEIYKFYHLENRVLPEGLLEKMNNEYSNMIKTVIDVNTKGNKGNKS